ncbi:MAG: sialate O-acetylesterase [Pirellulales bacterium]
MPCRSPRFRCGLLLLALLAAADRAAAGVRPAAVFNDHMVLQRGMPVPIWGSAEAAAEVRVSFAGQTVTAVAGSDGRWHAVLAPLDAAAAGQPLTIAAGDDRHVIADVVVGDVWLLGGQSNMEYTAGAMAARLPAGKVLVDAADLPGLRFCRIVAPAAAEPQADFATPQRWDVCTPAAGAAHSAVGFVFARRLHEALGVPVGMIDTSVGGTPIEPWIPAGAFAGHPTLEAIAAHARAGDIEAIRRMRGGTFVRGDHWLPGRLFNDRVAALVPLAIHGVAWYQGESNCGRGEDPRDYAAKLGALVAGWRSAWSRPDLPVAVVQLPQWKSYAWPFLRAEQRRATAGLGHTGLVVTIDLDHADDIHPPDKISVGERLASWSLARIHGREIAAEGPVFAAARRRGAEMVVRFTSNAVGDGLMAGRLAAPGEVVDSGSPVVNGFELCTADGAWHGAAARIVGSEVVVTSAAVAEPVAVRYACQPEARRDRPWNLHGRSGLPVGPFCSDPTRMPYEPEQNPP